MLGALRVLSLHRMQSDFTLLLPLYDVVSPVLAPLVQTCCVAVGWLMPPPPLVLQVLICPMSRLYDIYLSFSFEKHLPRIYIMPGNLFPSSCFLIQSLFLPICLPS